jgi:hypothetical protein
VTQLEALLLLRRFSEREWTAAEVSKELYSNDAATADMLDKLAKDGILKNSKGGSTQRYVYAPDSATDRAIQLVERSYVQQRVRIIDLIFSKPHNQLQHFAEAFKLKHEDKDK